MKMSVHKTMQSMLSILLIILAVSYFGLMTAFAASAMRSSHSFDRSFRPTVSIIIAARNEEANIAQCLDSILRLTYPRGQLEVIVVDDQSSDRTSEIVAGYSKSYNHIRLDRTVDGEGNLRGKANAVDTGIQSSTGEILLFTDADCTVPTGWVEETIKYYTGPSIGLVAGFTFLKSSHLFGQIQALDWFSQFTMASGALGLGFPITAVGNNLSVRRTTYDETGGFHKIPFSVTEDHALFKAIVENTGFATRFPLDLKTLVESQPCKSVSELFRQKKRWFTGGLNLDILSIVVFSAIYLLKLILIVVSFVNPSLFTILLLGFTYAAEVILTLPAIVMLRKLHLLWITPLFFLYFALYTLLLPPIVLANRKVSWKDRKYEADTD